MESIEKFANPICLITLRDKHACFLTLSLSHSLTCSLIYSPPPPPLTHTHSLTHSLSLSLHLSHSLTHTISPPFSGPDRPIVTLESRRYLIQRYGEQLPPLNCSIQPSANSNKPGGQATMRWEGPRGTQDTGVTELELNLGQFESELTGEYLCSASNVRGDGGPVEVYIHSEWERSGTCECVCDSLSLSLSSHLSLIPANSDRYWRRTVQSSVDSAHSTHQRPHPCICGLHRVSHTPLHSASISK